MRNAVLRVCTVAVALAAADAANASPPDIVVSIAPVHSLVASVMQGVAEPRLIVPANVSDHDYSLKPSDLRAIAAADLVVWVGESLETYLAKPLQTEGVRTVELIEAAGIDPHKYSVNGAGTPEAESPHAGEHRHDHGHDHLGLDPHVWLDPIRARAIVQAAEASLVAVDPENAASYRRNAAAALVSLEKLDGDIRQQLAPFAGKPFITFHDGYSYFVERYGLNQVGQLSIEPEQQAGAASVSALKGLVAREGIACAFAEPQYDAGSVQALAGENNIRVGVLDAIGADLEPGPALYEALLRKNATAVADCLGPTS
jgi:zinc transport system substrate-binding protein